VTREWGWPLISS